MKTLKSVGIIGTGLYVPERVMTNFDLEKIVETTDEWIISRTGIKERRIASENEACSDLAAKAAEKARAEAVALLEKVKAGQAIDEQLTKLNAKVEEKKGMARFGTDIPASLAQVVFRLAKPADKMVSAGLYSDELGNQSVLVLEKVISAPESADSPLQQGLSQQVIKLKQEETYGALIEQLRQKADIKYAAETKESTD